MTTTLFTETACELCQERFRPIDEIAEMYDPDNDADGSLIVHADCGLSRGFEIA
ncbi:hypothetical protein [Desertimonas flava]|uniref:hypothetical protein n=1 Tax=Desertimonas flava TaxID=2064846 RepID=UPI0013C4E3AF|nr:hypothetical protein [Desertimonas flava]